MKLSSILILSFCSTIAAFGQQDSGFTDKKEAKNLLVNGKKEGKWVEYRTVIDIGDNVTTDTNAPRYFLTIYKAGVPYGIQRWYNKEGDLQETVPYTDSNINGMVRFYYKNKKVEMELPYTNGFENGTAKEYYPNGMLKKESPYTNSRENGVEKSYFESGKLEETIPFTDGVENGISKWYYENGKIRAITNYVNGTGVSTMYDKNGNEIKQ